MHMLAPALGYSELEPKWIWGYSFLYLIIKDYQKVEQYKLIFLSSSFEYDIIRFR
jgi:hypothetical protein